MILSRRTTPTSARMLSQREHYWICLNDNFIEALIPAKVNANLPTQGGEAACVAMVTGGHWFDKVGLFNYLLIKYPWTRKPSQLTSESVRTSATVQVICCW